MTMETAENKQPNSETSFKRQTAVKARIKDLLHGEYIVKDGWQPNVLRLKNNQELSRVNLMGIIVDKGANEEKTAVLDDGDNQIMIRVLDEGNPLENSNMGDVSVVIGRPRLFNNEIYIMPEIVRKIDSTKWMEIRKIELNKLFGSIVYTEKDLKKTVENKQQINISENTVEKEKVISEIISDQEIVKEESLVIKEENSAERIIKIIKDLDTGDGVDIDYLLEKYNKDDGEKIISDLMKSGDIFEIKAGKVKVLE
ncbi:hypothetical protein ACFL0W_05280 [Nanoarchaeota archaeon]